MDFKKKLKIARYIGDIAKTLETAADGGIAKTLKNAAETSFEIITNKDTWKNVDKYVSVGMEYAEIGAKNASKMVADALEKSEAYGFAKEKALAMKKKLEL